MSTVRGIWKSSEHGQKMVDIPVKLNPTMGGQGAREEVEGDGQADQESPEGKENQEST